MRLLALVVLIFTSGVINAQEELSIEKAWARESPPGSPNGVAYFVIKNSGAEDRLIGISIASEVADRAELHTHKNEDGMMKMEKVDAIEIPERGHAMLKPHGDHVMLVGLKQLLKEGETISLELQFEKAGTIKVDVPVLKEAPSGYSH